MTQTGARYEFAPQPTPGGVQAMLLALLAHGLLLLVLTVGVQWKRNTAPVTVEAELWSSIPQEAAPPADELPLPAEPTPPPPPVVRPSVTDADIALAKEKARQQKEKQQQEKLREEKLQREKQEKLEKEKRQKEKDAADKAARDKKAQVLQEAKKMEELRQQQLKRMANLAGGGGSGDLNSKGTATQSKSLTASYRGRINARIKPNITYTDAIVGNPTVEVEVRSSPDGTILSRKIIKPSGVLSWDEAVLRAIDKTEVLPRNEDGIVPSPMILVVNPLAFN